MFEHVILIGKNTLKWLLFSFFKSPSGSNLFPVPRLYMSDICLNLFDSNEWSCGGKSAV